MWDRNVEASYDSATHVTYTGLVNFTNGNPGSADSGNCLVNSLLYDESSPLQVRAGPHPATLPPPLQLPVPLTDRERTLTLCAAAHRWQPVAWAAKGSSAASRRAGRPGRGGAGCPRERHQ